MKEWEIDTKTVCIVHGNAVNIKNAVTAMAQNIKSRTCSKHVHVLLIHCSYVSTKAWKKMK